MTTSGPRRSAPERRLVGESGRAASGLRKTLADLGVGRSSGLLQDMSKTFRFGLYLLAGLGGIAGAAYGLSKGVTLLLIALVVIPIEIFVRRYLRWAHDRCRATAERALLRMAFQPTNAAAWRIVARSDNDNTLLISACLLWQT